MGNIKDTQYYLAHHSLIENFKIPYIGITRPHSRIKDSLPMMTHRLLIEDNKGVMETTAELLALEGYKISKATNGKPGLENILVILPDVIICDILMLEMDGLQLLLEVTKYPRSSTIPLIFMTAKTEKNDIKYGLDMGADDYLTKPCELEVLLKSIENCLQKKKFLLAEHRNPDDLTTLKTTKRDVWRK